MPGEEPTVLARRDGRAGVLTLNRPRALNALTLGMVREVAQALAAWREDPAVHLVILTAAGDRAFCAGGDIREIRRLVQDQAFDQVEAFFVEEYALNRVIARYPKPFVSLIDGICMGGGIGLSVHGTCRVATERAAFAMPETAIGLFPDVGASFILPRLRSDWGMYLGLTGARVEGGEAVRVGLGTHHVPRARLDALRAELAREGASALAPYAEPPASEDPEQLGLFGAADLPAVEAGLAGAPGPWAQAAREALARVSPSALLWTFELLRRGAASTLEQCQAMELALTRHVVRHPDFTEGVRAMVVDKDRAPRWSPASIAEVPAGSIAAMFG